MDHYQLEDRIIAFSASIIKLSRLLPNNFEGKHISNQLIRSGSSVALNYGEAQAGESRKDFIHKMKVSLKELRETFICLKLIREVELIKSNEELKNLIKENNELISIFVVSIKTAINNV